MGLFDSIGGFFGGAVDSVGGILENVAPIFDNASSIYSSFGEITGGAGNPPINPFGSSGGLAFGGWQGPPPVGSTLPEYVEVMESGSDSTVLILGAALVALVVLKR